MWSVSRSKLGHPERRDWGQGSSRSPRTPNVTVAIGDVGEQSVRGASFIFNRTATIDAILDWKGRDTFDYWFCSDDKILFSNNPGYSLIGQNRSSNVDDKSSKSLQPSVARATRLGNWLLRRPWWCQQQWHSCCLRWFGSWPQHVVDSARQFLRNWQCFDVRGSPWHATNHWSSWSWQHSSTFYFVFRGHVSAECRSNPRGHEFTLG